MSGERSRKGSGVLGSAGWQALGQFTPLVINLVLTPFVISTLGVTAYGLWLVTSILTSFIGHVDGGIGATALRYFSRFAGKGGEEGHRLAGRYVVSLMMLMSVIVFIVVAVPFVFAGSLMDFFHASAELHAGATFLLRTTLFLLAIGLYRNILAGVLNAHQRYALTSITNVASHIVYSLSLYFTLSAGLGLYGTAYSFMAQAAVATLFIVPSALRLVTFRGAGLMSRAEVKEFLGLAWKVQITGLLHMLSFQGVILIIGRAAPGQVVAYGPGSNFAQQMRLLPNTAVTPMQSAMGQTIGREGDEAGRRQFVSLQRAWVVFLVGWVAVGAPASMNGVNSWLPLPEDMAGQVAAILLFSHLITLLPAVLSQWLMLDGRPEPQMWNGIVTTSVTLALTLLFIEPFGSLGVAVGVTLAQVAGVTTMLTVATRRGGIPRSPFREIPWVPALTCSALSFVTTGFMARVLENASVEGIFGLLSVAASAAPPFALYFLWVFGLRRTLRMIRTRRLS